MNSAFAIAGPRLLDNGVSVLPIMAGSKAPGRYSVGTWWPAHDWQKYCTRIATSYEVEVWEGWPDAGVGAALGPSSAPAGFQLMAVDLDSDEPAVRAALMAVLPASPVRKRGRKGETSFYLAPVSVPNRPYNDAAKQRLVDLLGNGRQTVLPPTIHDKTGLPFVWLTPDTLENYAVADLPVLPADVADIIGTALESFGYQAPEFLPCGAPGTATLDGDDTPHRLLNEAALANLDAWVPALQLFGCRRTGDGKYKAVASWRPSASNRHLSKRATNLAISGEGIKDCGDQKGYTPLDLVMAACAADLDTAFRWLQERVAPQRTVLLTSTPAALPPPAEEPTPARVGNLRGLVVPGTRPALTLVQFDPETGEVLNELPVAAAPLREPPTAVLPVDLCYPAGLLGEVSEWITQTAAKPVPQHNLGAAIVMLGAAMGRRFESPTRARTNFYVMGVAGSGYGKDHPLSATRILTVAAGLQKVLGPEGIKSGSALRKVLEAWPARVMLMDEFGGFLRRILDRRAGSHDKEIRDLLLTLFSRANGDYTGSEGAMEKAVLIRNPHLGIYGASTPDDLWDAFNSSSGKDGLLARFLVFNAGQERPRRGRPALEVTDPPRALIGKIRALMDVRPAGNLNGVGEQAVKPIRADWGDGAEEWFMACDERNMDLADRGGARGTVYARVAEQTLKLALVYAVGCEPARPVITVASLEWAAAVVACSTAALFAAMEDRIADNEQQANYLWTLRTIREAGSHGITMTALKRAINGRFDQRRTTDILGQLFDAGQVSRPFIGSGPSGGRPAERIKAMADEEEAA
jgi:hypothetical protein